MVILDRNSPICYHSHNLPPTHSFLRILTLLSYWRISIDFCVNNPVASEAGEIRGRRCFSASYIQRRGAEFEAKIVFFFLFNECICFFLILKYLVYISMDLEYGLRYAPAHYS